RAYNRRRENRQALLPQAPLRRGFSLPPSSPRYLVHACHPLGAAFATAQPRRQVIQQKLRPEPVGQLPRVGRFLVLQRRHITCSVILRRIRSARSMGGLAAPGGGG